MSFPSYDGFFDELRLVKQAFDEADAMRVARLAKPKQLPAAAARSLSAATGQPMPLAAMRHKSLVLKDQSRALADFIQPVTNTPKAELIARSRQAVAPTLPAIIPSESRIVQGRGALSSVRRMAKSHFNPTTLPAIQDPKQNRMLQGILKGHEMDELRPVRPSLFSQQFGHQHPSVIYREHNRVATLPPGFEKTRAFMTKMRGGLNREAEAFMPKQIPYGSGPRLSRHAIRRLSEAKDQMVQAAQNSGPLGGLIRKQRKHALLHVMRNSMPIREKLQRLAAKARVLPK